MLSRPCISCNSAPPQHSSTCRFNENIKIAFKVVKPTPSPAKQLPPPTNKKNIPQKRHKMHSSPRKQINNK